MNAMNSNRNIVLMSNKIGKSRNPIKGVPDTSISTLSSISDGIATDTSNTSNTTNTTVSTKNVSVTSDNNLNIDDIFRFMELYFNRAGIMYSHLYNSMNKFLDEDIKVFLENGDHTFFEKIDKNKIYKYKFKYEQYKLFL